MDKKRLIVFTVTNDLSYDQRMQRHSNILSDNGFDVLLIGRKRNFSIPLKKEKYQQKRISCFFDKGKLFYLEYNIRLLFVLLMCKADIYGAIDLDTLVPNAIATRIRGKKLVFDSHEYFTEVPELEGRVLTKNIWEIIARNFIPIADKAYTVGPELATLFAKLYKIPFTYILNAPRLNERQEEFIYSKKIILYQGALNKGRCLEQMILAMHDIDAEFWLAGEGDLSRKLRDLVQIEKLENKVVFLGFIEPQKLLEYTKMATIGYNVLEPNGLSYQYSLANKFFDYMHSGVPQIGSDFIEYRKINEEFEVAILTNWDQQSIKDGVLKLFTDNQLYLRLKKNCVSASLVYNLENESKKLIQIYRDI